MLLNGPCTEGFFVRLVRGFGTFMLSNKLISSKHKSEHMWQRGMHLKNSTNIKYLFLMFLKEPITFGNGCCDAFIHSGCWIFCCCDNAPGWASLSGAVSECPFLKVFASSLLDCVCKPADPTSLQKYSYIQSWRKTELWFVMAMLQSWWRGEGGLKKNNKPVFLLSQLSACTVNFKLTCSCTLLCHKPENKLCLRFVFPNTG